MTKGKKKKYLGKHEFIFNLISLIIIIGIAIYFGWRSIYYYSLQNNKSSSSNSLGDTIISNNKLASSGDGFYKDSDGYFFKGNITNNYVYAFNRLFRVLGVSDDGSVRLVSEDNVASFMWGDNYHYRESNLYTWLTKTSSNYSGVYYDTIPDNSKILTKTSYREDVYNKKIIKGKSIYKDYVSTISLSDYINSGASSGFLNNKKLYYLIGLDKDHENLYVDEEGKVASCDGVDGYGVRAVISLKKNIKSSGGDGSLNNPYTISSSNNYIDSFVRLGNDTWKVFNNSNGVLKMYLYGYMQVNGVEASLPYSREGSLFDISDRKSIAYYLNNTYYKSLPYRGYLVPNNYYTGEVSQDTHYKYEGIYTSSVNYYVGLLNIFDYVSNNYFDNIYHLNTTSSVGNSIYVTYSTGMMEDASVSDARHVAPVISINSTSIRRGSGALNDPYMVE